MHNVMVAEYSGNWRLIAVAVVYLYQHISGRVPVKIYTGKGRYPSTSSESSPWWVVGSVEKT